MERIQIIGHVGHDPVDHSAKTGKPFVTFSVACTSKYEDNEYTNWYQVLCNGNRAEYALKNVGKGDTVFIEGRPKPHGHANADYEVKAEIQINVKELLIRSKSKIIVEDSAVE